MEQKKCRQCGMIKPVDNFRTYHNSTTHGNLCSTCEKMNGQWRYIRKKLKAVGNDLTQLTPQERERFETIEAIYKEYEARGFQIPKITGVKGSTANVEDDSALKALLSALQYKGCRDAAPDGVDRPLEASTGESVIDETIAAKGKSNAEQKRPITDFRGRSGGYTKGNGPLTQKQMIELGTRKFTLDGESEETKSPNKPAAAFVDKTTKEVVTRQQTVNAEAMQTLTDASVVPSEDEIETYKSEILSGNFTVLEQIAAHGAEELQTWLTCELTEEPDYYMDVVYDRLRDKYMPVISGTAGTFKEERANVQFKPILEEILKRFEDYEDEYWETH